MTSKRDVAVPPQDEVWTGVLEVLQEIRNYTKPSEISDLWRAEAYTLTPDQSQTIVRRNWQRRRCLIFTDGANATGVGVSPGVINGALEPRAGLVVLAPGAPPVELTHCGEIHAKASSAATVYVIEEYARDG